MFRMRAGNMDKRRLRILLGLFFIALAIPSAMLTWQAYSRLKWETFHQYQSLAEQLLGRVDRRLREMVAKEEKRAFTDYRFLVVEGAPEANYLQRSPLSRLPVDSDVPGLLGYFQIDAGGHFTTPLLPDDPELSALAYGVTDGELAERKALRERLLQILSREDVAGAGDREDRHAPPDEGGRTAAAAASAGSGEADGFEDTGDGAIRGRSAPTAASRPPLAEPEPTARDGHAAAREQQLAQAAFERLSEESVPQRKAMPPSPASSNIGRVDELKLDRTYEKDEAPAPARRPLSDFKKSLEIRPAQVEREVVASRAPMPRDPAEAGPGTDEAAPVLVGMFQSEVEPFTFGVIGGDHFVLYRKVWREGQRFIQGAVIEKATMLRQLIETPYRETALAGMSRLGIVFDGDILSALGGQQAGRYLSRSDELSGTLLYRGRLSTPLDRLELILTVTRIPSAPAAGLVIWVAVALGLVLSGGLALMYRLGAKQIELNRQQRDFVSAVSHELKTPLTSIRMYSEMLREGWVDQARKHRYYDFIHDESERLSRLIGNVLHLARMSRDELGIEPKPVEVGRLMDLLESKVSTQVAHAGFALQIDCGQRIAQQCVEADEDAFVQILINLVDNAIKFSAQAAEKRIEIVCDRLGDGRVEFRVRDHGPGIPRDQMKKIFQLFYRSENELTRETLGTGIGLALVHRLAKAMGGEVDVVNRDPGAEFRLRLPAFLPPSG